ncbi:MAG: 3-hydroxybutyryl-CoA dehydrogenase [Flavobacteriales bacterium]
MEVKSKNQFFTKGIPGIKLNAANGYYKQNCVGLKTENKPQKVMKNITVIGAGTMGNGIAHVFAQHGHQVSLVDVSQVSLDKALTIIAKNLDRQVTKESITEIDKQNTLNNITTHTQLAEGIKTADLVIEAATENVELKLKIFSDMDELAPAHAILSTNTSSISITRIAAQTRRPDKVIGMHFMNPVPVMKLVEVIRGYATSDEVTRQVMEISKKLSKVPVEVNDHPGFVANKILMPMINEAIITLHEGTAGVEEIDTVMKLGMAHPMGPLQLADFIGLDVCLAILRVLKEGYGNPKYAPCPLLVNMVTAGKLGVKTGEGFYSWGHGTKNLIVAHNFKK